MSTSAPKTPSFAPQDKYAHLVQGGLGRRIATALGLPRPARLQRFDGEREFVDGPSLVLGAGPVGDAVSAQLLDWGRDVHRQDDNLTDIAHLVLSVADCRNLTEFNTLMLAAAPVQRRLARSARIVFVTSAPEAGDSDVEHACVQRAGLGAMRALAHEVRGGATANLIDLARDAATGPGASLAPSASAALRFFASTRSAFVNGQPLRVDAAGPAAAEAWPLQPLAGQVAVVTGAARGIGAAIARTLQRDGARVIAIDVPAAGDALARLANSIDGTALQVDVTAERAGQEIVDHARQFYGRLDIMVHNAGITRDRMFANMDDSRWNSVLEVNLASQLRINAALLESDLFQHAPRVVSLASTSAIAGNRGQTNYAASKAGVMASVAHLSERLGAVGGTANAVAPGFIETDMTAKIPFATQQVARRLSSLGQGGLPQDVAETIAFLCWPQAAGVKGQTLRVCGQNLVGA
ncbi:3-oxoacyl-ACP reductase [Micrococcales bacterium 31B]|nr:3-oxoacyl-ACP reductase [Micrococcales bacterium 31B]